MIARETRRGGGVLVLALGADVDAVGVEHLDGRLPRGQRQGVRVLADEQGAGDALAARYSTIACVVAAMWASLNAVVRLEPR
jgi:hypothetical protein